MHSQDGALTYQAYGKKKAIYSVSRGHLNAIMMNLAEEKGVHNTLLHQCLGADLKMEELH